MTERSSKTSGDVNNVRRAIAFVGIMCILISQFLIFSQPVDHTIVFPPYTFLAFIGIVIFSLSWFIKPNAILEKAATWLLFNDWVFWLFVAFALSGVVTFAIVNLTLFARINYIPVVTLWLFSASAYVYVFWDHSINLSTLVDWFKKNQNELLSVLAVTLLAVVVRFYKLGGIPRILDGDEGLIGLFAQSTTSGTLANPFALWENFGAMYLQLINTSIGLFGVNAFALRLLPAIGGTLAIPSIYLLARWIGGRRIALIAALILAFSHTHIHFSRIVSVAYIHGTWLAPLELYLLLSGLEKRQSWRTALSGIILAIHFSVYVTAQVIAALAFIFMLLSLIFYRQWFKERIRQALVFWGAFLTLILPSAYYIFKNPNEFFSRMSANGTFQSGWLQLTMETTGQSAVEVLFGRFVHAFLSLIYYPAFDFYGSTSPVMSMITSAFFLAGLVIALLRLRKSEYLLLNGYFWGATFSVGIFAIPPSADSYRMLMALPAAFIMAALGLDQILEAFGFGWKNNRSAYIFSASAVLTSLLIFNMWTYYGDFAGKCRFGNDLVGRFASYLGSYAGSVENEYPIYLLSDTNYFYGSHGSTDFLSQRRAIINVSDPVDTLNPVSGETIIANPDRIPELEAWARTHPGGQLNYRYDCDKTILLAYQVP